MLNAKQLQELYVSLNLCNNSLEYIMMFKEFLNKVGIDTSMMGVNTINYTLLKYLSSQLEISEVIIRETCECGETLLSYVNVSNIIYQLEREYDMLDKGFIISIQEPPFILEELNNPDNMDFVNGIKELRFKDGGPILKLTDLGSNAPSGQLSELDTFFSMIDLEIYNDISEVMFQKPLLAYSSECSSCGFSNEDITDDIISIIVRLLIQYLE